MEPRNFQISLNTITQRATYADGSKQLSESEKVTVLCLAALVERVEALIVVVEEGLCKVAQNIAR